MINFTNLKKLISDKTVLEIISVIRAGIKYKNETKEITFQLEEQGNNAQKMTKSQHEKEIYPEVTHSHIKINEFLELIAEIKYILAIL